MSEQKQYILDILTSCAGGTGRTSGDRDIGTSGRRAGIEIERRFFDAESMDADASIDRGARKLSKFTVRCGLFAS